MDREAAEKVLVDVRRQRDEAEALAQRALDGLQHTALNVGHTLVDIDAELLRARADDLSLATVRLKTLDDVARQVRAALM